MLTCYAEKRACYSLISYKTKKTQSCTDRSGTKIRTVRVRQDSCIYIGSNLFLIERETVHDIRWMSVLHRPEQSGDLERSSPAESFIARDGVLEVHWTSVSTDRSGTKIRTVRVRQDSFIYKRYPFRIPFVYKKSARRDSNPRPRPWQGRAPPTEPLAHKKCYSQAHGYYTI